MRKRSEACQLEMVSFLPEYSLNYAPLKLHSFKDMGVFFPNNVALYQHLDVTESPMFL